MIFLVDHNLERHALILSGSISNQGWLNFLTIRFVTLEEMALAVESNDRVIELYGGESGIHSVRYLYHQVDFSHINS